jgi:primary-amine oxidase
LSAIRPEDDDGRACQGGGAASAGAADGGEIEAVSRILKRDRGLADSARFVYVTLREPAKDVVLKYQPGEAFDREAHVVLRERAERTSYEAVVSLTAGEVRLWREVPGVQPPVMLEEFVATEETVRKDARWQEAMRRPGSSSGPTVSSTATTPSMCRPRSTATTRGEARS